MKNVKISYDMMSTFKFMPASPIFFNSGTPEAQLSSCFLVTAEPDAERIFETLSLTSTISGAGGGIGLGLQALPAQGYGEFWRIMGTRTDLSHLSLSAEGVERSGLTPVLKLFDALIDVVGHGVNKRPTAICAYVEPWHADILTFVRMRRLTGGEATHIERLFLGLWVNDLL